jgi:phospholipid transport system substrate-binding protein
LRVWFAKDIAIKERFDIRSSLPNSPTVLVRQTAKKVRRKIGKLRNALWTASIGGLKDRRRPSNVGRRRSAWRQRATQSITLVLAAVLAASATSAAPEPLGPLAKVRTTLDDALAILHDQQQPVAQRRRELLRLAEQNLDLSRMARESLGTHWNELTPAERQQFVALFGAFIEAAYLTQIQEYVNLTITVGAARNVGADYAEVDATVVQPHQETMPITFKLERHDDDWLVYDVAVEGVSMVENYRAQFYRVIDSRGLAQLLNDLREKQNQLAALIGKP